MALDPYLAAAVALLAGVGLGAAWHRWRRTAGHPVQAVATPAPQRPGALGLASREQFDEALDYAQARCERLGLGLNLLVVDLDNLRLVNQAYGHQTGDQVLTEVAQRLSLALPTRALATRLAGDEFALVVEGGAEPGRQAAEAVRAALRRPMLLSGHALQLDASIGIARYPQHGSGARLLMQAAAAARSVKLSGGAGFAEFEPSMAADVRQQAELLRDLRQALERGEFELVYQPKIDAASLQVTAAEALLRWQHPRRGLVEPQRFILLAERHGLMCTIGRWVIDEACRQAAHWKTQGLRMRVAVNLSGAQLRQDDLVEQIGSALARHGLSPGRFTCEITETVAMEDTQVTRDAFARLRRSGVHLSIDDFGTGHSSLAVLRRLPAAELKLDRAFVTDLASSEQARSIAQAVLQMAHSLSMRVVAEGVESAAQRDLLVAMGCDELQGFLFARPMSAKALALWAMDERAGASPAFRESLFKETAPTALGR
jgi:diguanylate cyclase (GGDEF)-like protein